MNPENTPVTGAAVDPWSDATAVQSGDLIKFSDENKVPYKDQVLVCIPLSFETRPNTRGGAGDSHFWTVTIEGGKPAKFFAPTKLHDLLTNAQGKIVRIKNLGFVKTNNGNSMIDFSVVAKEATDENKQQFNLVETW